VRGTVNLWPVQWFLAHPGRGPGLRKLTGNYVCCSDWTASSIDRAHSAYRAEHASCMFNETQYLCRGGRLVGTTGKQLTARGDNSGAGYRAPTRVDLMHFAHRPCRSPSCDSSGIGDDSDGCGSRAESESFDRFIVSQGETNLVLTNA
jgi:hypothetical protein